MNLFPSFIKTLLIVTQLKLFLHTTLLVIYAGNPPEYKGPFPFLKTLSKRSTSPSRSKVVVLPVVSELEDQDFEGVANEQLTTFFRAYNYLVPSLLETKYYLKQQNIQESGYEKEFEALASKFQAKFIVLLYIKALKHRKAPNAIGLVTSRSLPRASLTAVGRKTYGEYLLKIYDSRNKKIDESSAVADRKDPLLGFWRSSKSLAMKVQKEVLDSLLSEFATQKILRSEGYILAPINKYHPDAKGFQ